MIEYIKSSGTQYINTGFIPTNNTKVKLSMGEFSGTGASNCLFGARAARSADASVGRGLQFSVNATTTPRDYGGMFGRNYGPQSGMTSGMFAWADGGDYILEVSQSGFYENGVNKLTPQTVTFTSPVSLCIFCNNTNGTIDEKTAYKLYCFKIYESGTLVRDFLPCYRKSDNVIGLYDLVNNQFYTNAGTGSFIKGPDVKGAKIQRIYIGSNLVRPKRQPTSHTLLYCPLNENINDATGNHTMTTVTGTYGGVTKDSTGFYYFNGGYIKSESWTGPKQCTLSGWFNRATKSKSWVQGYALSMHFSTPEAQPYHTVAFNIGKTAEETAAIICPVSGSSYGSKIVVRTSQPTIGTWTQWTMTYSSSDGLKLYVDGVLAGQTSGGADIYQYNMPTEIGATANQYQYYQGYIAEVIYEDKVRTPSEVTMWYNQSKGRFI